LLRAFDDGKPGVATWSTARTGVGPLPRVEAEKGGAKAHVDPVERDASKSSRLPSPQRLLRDLQQSSAATKKISALVVAAALLVCVGTLVARSVAKRFVPGSVRSAAAVPVRATAPVEPRAAMQAPPEPPNSTLTNGSPLLAEATAPEPSTGRTPAGEVARGKPFHDKQPTARDNSVSNEGTLARQAVDALLAGDRPRALLYYRELSRKAPDRRVYREAVRLLAPSAPTTPQ
jgi:hypothetical protein